MSVFIQAEKLGLWTASFDELWARPDGGALLANYLKIVGTLLRDGHFKQAKQQALEFKAFMKKTPSAK